MTLQPPGKLESQTKYLYFTNTYYTVDSEKRQRCWNASHPSSHVPPPEAHGPAARLQERTGAGKHLDRTTMACIQTTSHFPKASPCTSQEDLTSTKSWIIPEEDGSSVLTSAAPRSVSCGVASTLQHSSLQKILAEAAAEVSYDPSAPPELAFSFPPL
ncbi:hypothetical protein AV530_009423 [Patagioenas fasciata monilis]|uniref:Uncharacterized protein n=1 Tax=Patagioenas fasciata monilis TaxID=372326 RepID=A0A1V4JJ62_PATFA|nr:hypothetical protein AV530_009423 [Patagioenas fasciata monilis]